ncbi:MAG: hypothetical protein LQ352_002894 [Teloschistes flavicans]|nr:MAG: hypothetical protein LQ352_002894 [Teloschistes flavicans]
MPDFASRLQAFLKPTSKEIQLSQSARKQENLYLAAYNAFFTANARSTCTDIIVNIWCRFLDYQLRDNERIWKMNLMARTHLLLGHFQHNTDSTTFYLYDLWGDARRTAKKELRYDTDIWTKRLEEVRDLCDEMYWRISAEKPRERFEFDDGNFKWTLRMTDKWLEATNHWREQLPSSRRMAPS